MKILIPLLLVDVFPAAGLSADKPLAWPQFRGPNGSGEPEVAVKNPKLGERISATPFGNRIQVVDLHDESLVWLLPYQEVQKAGIKFAD